MRRGLGKGLEELLAIYDTEERSSTEEKEVVVDTRSDKGTVTINKKDGVSKIPISEVYPNPNQPRKHFDQESLQELADSIRIHGLIQPIIVNKSDDGYLIIAGERRYKASK